MSFKFSVGKCPGGFIEHGNNCYKVSSEKLSWNKARFACQSLDGNYDLAVVDNLELFEFLNAYNNHWIGLYSPGAERDFRWVDGSKLEFGKVPKQKPWGRNEPNVNHRIRYQFNFILIPFQNTCLQKIYQFFSLIIIIKQGLWIN